MNLLSDFHVDRTSQNVGRSQSREAVKGSPGQLMKKAMSLLCVVLAMALFACSKSPTTADLIGTWGNADGGRIVLSENGQFTASALPKAIFWRTDERAPSLNGKGQWKISKGRAYWEVRLRFEELSGDPASLEIVALVSGAGRSAYLYQWRDEEGGARYELERKP
jgi:hypothetical protein